MGPHRERELTLHMGGASQFENLNGPSSALALKHITENHNIVRDKLFNAVTRDWPVFIDSFSGHHSCDTDLLQACDETEDLPAHNKHRIILLKYSRNRIDCHPFSFVLSDGVINSFNQARQIETARHILTIWIR